MKMKNLTLGVVFFLLVYATVVSGEYVDPHGLPSGTATLRNEWTVIEGFNFSQGAVVSTFGDLYFVGNPAWGESLRSDCVYENDYGVLYSGYIIVSLDSLTTAPSSGYNGEENLTLNTLYWVRTCDGNFAKIKVTSISNILDELNNTQNITFDWVYQPDGGTDFTGGATTTTSSTSTTTTTTLGCTDTDGGPDIYTKGTTTGVFVTNPTTGVDTYTDECHLTEYGNYQVEYYCNDDNYVTTITAVCPSGYDCQDGVCVAASTTTSTTSTTTTTLSLCGNGICESGENYENCPGDCVASIEITPPSQTVTMSSTFTVNVTVNNVRELFAVQFDLSFNSTTLQCDSVTRGDFLGADILPIAPTINNTVGNITGFALSRSVSGGVDGSGTIATIQFTALTPGTSALTLGNILLLDNNTLEISPSIINGTVIVPEAKVEIIPPSQIVALGSTITVNITVAEVASLFSAQFDLTFNPAVLECNSMTAGDFLGTDILEMPATVDNILGNISGFAITAMGNNTASGSGTLASLQFTTIATGNSTLGLSNVQLLNPEMTQIGVITADGNIIVETLGDASGDNQVNVIDLGMLGMSWGSSSGGSNYNNNADFNHDGKIDLFDLAILGQSWGNIY